MKINKTETAIVDICAGNGAIPLFLSQKTAGHITAIEIQTELANMAKRSVALNNLQAQIKIINADLKGIWKRLGSEKYATVTCNPPYFKETCSTPSSNNHLAIARHEIFCTLDDVINNSSQLLKQGGKLFLVYRPARLGELLAKLTLYRLEAKEIKFIYPKKTREANMVLVSATKDGKQGVKILPPLIVYDQNNIYTGEMEKIINGRK